MKKKNLLVSAVAMLVVSALGLTAATYAWFTASREPSIASFDMQVATTQALKISDKGSASTFETDGSAANQNLATGKDWVDVLSAARMKTTTGGANYYNPTTKLGDATPGIPSGTSPYFTHTEVSSLTAGGATNYADKKFVRSTTGNTVTNMANTESYLRFTVYFRAEAKQDVFLNLEKSSFVATVAADIAPAVRVAFAVHGANDSGITRVVYFAPNSGATGQASDGYDLAAAGSPFGWLVSGTNTVFPAADIGKQVTYSDEGQNEHDLLHLFEILPSGSNANDAIIGVTVFLWIEGFDATCININAGATITSILSFYGVEKV